MIHKKMEEAMNAQINEELWSSYLYLSMSAWFETQNLPGFANWMKVQAEEEHAHAMRFFTYLNDRGGRVLLKPIAAVQIEWKSSVDAFEETLNHERHITSCINDLMDVAIELRDHASRSFLQWYVDEQVEEEATAEQTLHHLNMISNNPHAMFMLDKEFSGRTFVDETAN